MEILTIAAEVDTTNPIQVMDVCDAIIDQMETLKAHANQFGDEITLRTGNLETRDDELVGNWVIEEKRRRR